MLASFYHSPDRASYLDFLLARLTNNSVRWKTGLQKKKVLVSSVKNVYTMSHLFIIRKVFFALIIFN